MGGQVFHRLIKGILAEGGIHAPGTQGFFQRAHFGRAGVVLNEEQHIFRVAVQEADVMVDQLYILRLNERQTFRLPDIRLPVIGNALYG